MQARLESARIDVQRASAGHKPTLDAVVQINRSGSETVYRGLTLAVIAYAVQASVNIAQPMMTPILFVLIGVLISKLPQTASIKA